jgi:cardiolipin synthase
VISALRVLLVIPIAVTLTRRELAPCLILFLVAAVSDGVDGFLARRYGWQSAAGAFLDTVADKLLMAVLFVTLTSMGLVPWWLTMAVVGRDIVIVGGSLAYRHWIGTVAIRPTPVSKLNTLFQLCFLAVVIARLQFSVMPAWIDVALGAMVFSTVAVSGLDYVLTYGRQALDASARRSPRGAPAPPAP